MKTYIAIKGDRITKVSPEAFDGAIEIAATKTALMYLYLCREELRYENGKVEITDAAEIKLAEIKETEYRQMVAALVSKQYAIADEIAFIYKPDEDAEKTAYRNYVNECKLEARTYINGRYGS